MEKILVCRLCCEICKTNFNVVNDASKEMLNFLLLNLDLNISNEPVMCNSCLNGLKDCFNFKKDYLRERDRTSIKYEDVQLRVPRVLLSEDPLKMSSSNNTCCSCCMELIKCETSVPLTKLKKKMTMMLEKYFPKLVLTNTVDTFCMACYKSLQNQLAFIRNCLAVEEKIKEYCKAEGTNDKGQVELCSVLHFVSKNELQSNIHSNCNAFKLEQGYKETENEDKVTVKNEDLIETEEPGIHCIKKENIDEGTEQDDSDRFVARPDLRDRSTMEAMVFKCEKCTYQSKRKRDLSSHMLTHKRPSEVIMHKCGMCTYQSKRKRDICRHMWTHKNASEVTMYKCEICSYQTRYKRNLQQHELIHKSTSEVMLYSCKFCTYRGKRKSNLSDHMLTHKDPSEVTIYKCETCTFQSKYKNTLKMHMLTHNDSSDVILYKCGLCKYQSTCKQYLSRHMATHKPPSEVTLYNCKICTYQSRRKSNVSNHVLIHKSASEVIMYKCETCKYKSKRKHDLARHMITHKSIS